MWRAEAGRRRGRLTLPHALVLGALQGAAELLPISSSAHIAVLPWLLGWSYGDLDEEVRKSFEVALHAGAAAALVLGLWDEVRETARGLDRDRMALLALSTGVPAAAGYALERPIERRLGTPGTIVGGLLAGSVAMAVADRAPRRRGQQEAGAADGLWLGLAQAAALVPGVSRSAATLAAARLRGFRREDASRLSRLVAFPVIVGASALRAVRTRKRPVDPAVARVFMAGTAAAFASSLVSTRLIPWLERERSLVPLVSYRVALAGAIALRLRRA